MMKLSAKIDILATIATVIAIGLVVAGIMFLTPVGEQSKLVNREKINNL